MKNVISVQLKKEETILKIAETAEQKDIMQTLRKKLPELKKMYKTEKIPIKVTGKALKNKEMDEIQNIIQKIQDTIDAGIESKIRGWTSGMYKYEAGANKPKTQTINVYQTNNIEQNPEMPSETYRKLRNIDEQLASSLAGM